MHSKFGFTLSLLLAAGALSSATALALAPTEPSVPGVATIYDLTHGSLVNIDRPLELSGSTAIFNVVERSNGTTGTCYLQFIDGTPASPIPAGIGAFDVQELRESGAVMLRYRLPPGSLAYLFCRNKTPARDGVPESENVWAPTVGEFNGARGAVQIPLDQIARSRR